MVDPYVNMSREQLIAQLEKQGKRLRKAREARSEMRHQVELLVQYSEQARDAVRAFRERALRVLR